MAINFKRLNWVFLLVLVSCTDPIRPEFEFKENLIYIESLASTSEGASYASLTKSIIDFGVYKNVFIPDASISFINSDNGTTVPLTLDNELYVPPNDFIVRQGETWKIHVQLADGTIYESENETAVESVAIDEIETQYNPEMYFSPEYDRYVPGHTISVSFIDSPEQKNYYYWRFRSYEKLVNCRICFSGYLREGDCQSINPGIAEAYKPYYTYACESDCWRIRYGSKIEIFSDKFTDGIGVAQLPVAEVLYYTKRDILVELQQFTLSEKAYEYYQTLKDIIDNNSGFNAPLPAALVGNMHNPDNDSEFVLGRFTVAATTTSKIWIDRTFIEEVPLEDELLTQPEGISEPTPSPQVFTAPCSENRYRTGTRPEGWID